jgi:hypothetical protein
MMNGFHPYMLWQNRMESLVDARCFLRIPSYSVVTSSEFSDVLWFGRAVKMESLVILKFHHLFRDEKHRES